MSSVPQARFDDLRSGWSIQFDEATDEIVAHDPADVPAALDRVWRARQDGRWAFGYVAYEAAPGLDDRLSTALRLRDLPLVWFGVVDHPGQATTAVPRAYRVTPWTPHWSEQQHAEKVAAVRAAIAAGDSYQCNLSTRLTARLSGDTYSFYRDLATSQRGSYNAYLRLGPWVVASASPECFVEWTGPHIVSAPMKGTAARGPSSTADRRARARLCASEKDRAENVMIVDLIRNDLSRIADPGSVTVRDLMRCEKYDTVWQLTSRVAGTIDPTATLTDVFTALFPCGSITGAPKISTMELIKNLEDGPRGVFCGAIGVVAPAGATITARFGVAIRTVLIDTRDQQAVYGAGGGVTWSSVAAEEYAEILTKARVLERARTMERPSARDFGLIETLAVRNRTAVNAEQHLARLQASADYFDFTVDLDRLRTMITQAADREPSDRLLRVQLSRDGTIALDTRRLSEHEFPVRLALDTERVDETSPFLCHKTTVRDHYTAARDRTPDADDTLLINSAGQVTEATIANIAVRIGDDWFTPPVEDGCLPGVGRQLLLEQGRLTVRSLTVAEVIDADDLALVSSARGWRPAILVSP